MPEKDSTAKIRANVFPAEAATADLEWSVVGADGNPTSMGSVLLKPGSPNEALVLFNRSGGTFKVQVSTKNGTDHVQVIGALTFTTKSDIPDRDENDPYIQQPAVENDGTNLNASMAPEAGGLGGINPGDWIAFKDLNFGETAPKKKISLTGCNGADDGTAAIIEIRKGSAGRRSGHNA